MFKTVSKFALVAICLSSSYSALANSSVTNMRYSTFNAQINCIHKLTTRVDYTIKTEYYDKVEEITRFGNDALISRSCHQTMTTPYEQGTDGKVFSGSLVPYFLSEDDSAAKITYGYMHNQVPMSKNAQLVVNDIQENLRCLAPYYSFKVTAGLHFESNGRNFNAIREGYGASYPSHIWMAIERDDGDVMAVLIENGSTNRVRDSLTTLRAIEQVIGENTIENRDFDILRTRYNNFWPCGNNNKR